MGPSGFFQRVAPRLMVEDLMCDLALSGALLDSLSAVCFYADPAAQRLIGVLSTVSACAAC